MKREPCTQIIVGRMRVPMMIPSAVVEVFYEDRPSQRGRPLIGQEGLEMAARITLYEWQRRQLEGIARIGRIGREGRNAKRV